MSNEAALRQTGSYGRIHRSARAVPASARVIECKDSGENLPARARACYKERRFFP